MTDAEKLLAMTKLVDSMMQNLKELHDMQETPAVPFWAKAWIRTLNLVSEERKSQIIDGVV